RVSNPGRLLYDAHQPFREWPIVIQVSIAISESRYQLFSHQPEPLDDELFVGNRFPPEIVPDSAPWKFANSLIVYFQQHPFVVVAPFARAFYALAQSFEIKSSHSFQIGRGY